MKSEAANPVSIRKLLYAGLALAFLVLIGSMSWGVWNAYQRAVDTAASETRRLVHILRQHTERTIDSADVLLKIVARRIGPEPSNIIERSGMTAALAHLTQNLPHMLVIRVLDGVSGGTLYEFTRSQVVGHAADLEAFAALRDTKSAAIHVGRPFKDELSGAWVVGLARRITGQEGIPGNIVIAHIDLDYFREFYDGIDVGAQGVINLARRDGTILLRKPYNEANIGGSIARSALFEHLSNGDRGTYESVSFTDGVHRIYSYQVLEELPLILTIGLSQTEVLSRWREAIKRDLLVAGFGTAALIIVTVLLLRLASRRIAAESALRGSEERLRLALSAGRMLAWEMDPKSGFIISAAEGFTVLPYAEVYQRVHPEHRATFRDAVARASMGRTASFEVRFRGRGGKDRWLEVRAIGLEAEPGTFRVVGTSFDITSRKIAEEQLWRAANEDSLTGLSSRSLFLQTLEKALTPAGSRRAGVLLIDLDDFKNINDTVGHDAGDALLRTLAQRLKDLATSGETIARLGGDEFALLLPNRDVPALVDFATRALNVLSQPVLYRGRSLITRASIGIAIAPDHDETPAELLKDADLAMYEAKGQGRNRVVIYNPAMKSSVEQRAGAISAFREAVDAGQVVPYYQPKICLRTGRIAGFEALARWIHPKRGVLTPGDFLAVFEDLELATILGSTILHGAIADMRSWLAGGVAFGHVAINLSAAEFSRADLADRMLEALSRAAISPRHLDVEVTETVLLGRNPRQVGAILQQFQAAGVHIALDDFGTGYASLAHLRQFPVDLIKIDRSFVGGLETEPEDAAIVSAVLGLAHSLGKKVVAEGVETAEQARFLQERGCEFAQGFLFSKPIPAADVPAFVARVMQAAATEERAPRSAA